ncbi:MAG: TadE family protein [Pirellulales bacterium]
MNAQSIHFQTIARRNRRRTRKGVAAVELAFVLPVLLVLVFGTIEICQRIFLRQSLVIAAYEGARLGARRNTTNAQVIDRCNTILQQRNVRGGSVTVTPANILSIATGEAITISVTAPWASNSPTRFVISDQGNLSVQAVMLRE